MDVVFRVLRYVVVDRLELVEHVLDRLHQYGLQSSGERIGVVGVIFRQCGCRFRLWCAGGVLAGLALQYKLADCVDVTCWSGRTFGGRVGFFPNVVKYSTYSVSYRVFYEDMSRIRKADL